MTTPATTHYTYRQAADLTEGAKSRDTIKRANERGEFPCARRRPGDPNGTWEIPLQDLIDTGYYQPPVSGSAAQDAELTVRRHREDRDWAKLEQELMRERARREALEGLLTEIRKDKNTLAKVIENLSSRAVA